jgi:hypothetical protein
MGTFAEKNREKTACKCILTTKTLFEITTGLSVLYSNPGIHRHSNLLKGFDEVQIIFAKNLNMNQGPRCGWLVIHIEFESLLSMPFGGTA